MCNISSPLSDPEPASDRARRIARVIARLASLGDDAALGVLNRQMFSNYFDLLINYKQIVIVQKVPFSILHLT